MVQKTLSKLIDITLICAIAGPAIALFLLLKPTALSDKVAGWRAVEKHYQESAGRRNMFDPLRPESNEDVDEQCKRDFASIRSMPAAEQSKLAPNYLSSYYGTIAMDLSASGRATEAETYTYKQVLLPMMETSRNGVASANVEFINGERALMFARQGNYDRASRCYDSCIRGVMSADCTDVLYLLPLYEAKADALDQLHKENEASVLHSQAQVIQTYLRTLRTWTRKHKNLDQQRPLESGEPIMARMHDKWRDALLVRERPAEKYEVDFVANSSQTNAELPKPMVMRHVPYGVTTCYRNF